jgi:hypothetical protein
MIVKIYRYSLERVGKGHAPYLESLVFNNTNIMVLDITHRLDFI